jgi:acetate kinase
MEKEDLGIKTANTLFNKHAGMLGLTGVSSDMREIEEAKAKGNDRAKLALEMYNYKVKKYIGSYMAAMNGLDILIMTGGIGENAATTREGVCSDLEWLGIEINREKNASIRGIEGIISTPGSKVKVLVVPTDEELMIALDTEKIVSERIRT